MTRARQRQMRGSLAVGLLLFAAPVVWLLLQQGVGALSYFHCRAAGPPWGALIGVGATLACAAAAGTCWRTRERGTEAHRFLMLIGAGAAAIFAATALVMTAALVMVPACAR